MLRLSHLVLMGQLGLAFTANMTEATVSFHSDPTIELDVDCKVTWGALPVGGPLGDRLERAIEESVHPQLMQAVRDRWVSPRSQTIALTDTGVMTEFQNAAERRAADAAAQAERRLSAYS